MECLIFVNAQNEMHKAFASLIIFKQKERVMRVCYTLFYVEIKLYKYLHWQIHYCNWYLVQIGNYWNSIIYKIILLIKSILIFQANNKLVLFSMFERANF